jgi:hypothetical protein
MITLNYLIRKKADVSADAFRDYWMGEHAAMRLAVCERMGIQKYTKCETKHEDPITGLMQQMYGTPADCYDFVDQMVINDLEDLKKGLGGAGLQDDLDAIAGSETAYVDFGGSDMWFSIDVPQVFAPGPCVAHPYENTLLKVYYVPRRHPHLSLAQAQLHWNSCHGAMARQFAEFLPYVKYIQGHRAESSVTDGLKASYGEKFEDIDLMIGQAEAWIDRRIVPSLQGPEVETMMGLLVEDITKFVDAGTSHIFAAKEHIILNKPVITTVPVLFDFE